MTRTQYYTATSIDGFIADPDNSLSWLFEADTGRNAGTRFTDFFAGVGAMALGSTTYEWVLDHEKLLERPGRWQEFYGDVPSWVFTHRELPAVPGADVRFVRGDVRPVHAEMVGAAGGRNIWIIGGGELAGRFADAGLLDEMHLGIAPVTLGGGAPLLPRRLDATRLKLRSVEDDGVFAFLTYDVGKPQGVPVTVDAVTAPELSVGPTTVTF